MRFIGLATLVLASPFCTLAQTEDSGVWGTIGIQEKAGKWNLGAEAELRTRDDARQVDRWSLQLSGTYDIAKPVSAGMSYQYMSFHDPDYLDYQPRHRMSMFLQGKHKLGDFTVSLRERIQVTIKDATDRVDEAGQLDTYAANPEWTWRNRLKVAYNIPRLPLTPSLAFESFRQMNNPDGNVFDKLRYTASLGYKITKRHEVEIYGLIDQDINVEEPVRTYIVGFGYVFTLK